LPVSEELLPETNWGLLASLRMVLALIVACGHLVWFDESILSQICVPLSGKAAVIGFFMVSGFSIAASLDRDSRGFYFRRFKRIYPLYFFCVALAIILQLWLGNFKLPHYELEASGPITSIGNLLMLQMTLVKSIAYDGVVWSLALECGYYLISPYLCRMHVGLTVALILISAVFYLLPYGWSSSIFYTILLKAKFITYFWAYGIGLVLYSHRSHIVAALFLALGLVLVYLSPITSEPLSVVTFAAAYIVLLIARVWQSKSAILDYLGDLSYPLYLIHIPTFIVCYALFGITNGWLLVAAAMATSALAFELIDVRLKKLIFGRRSNFSMAGAPS
jgi:peptidoglycan/LPS O-acetylase OafA/YrhL